MFVCFFAEASELPLCFWQSTQEGHKGRRRGRGCQRNQRGVCQLQFRRSHASLSLVLCRANRAAQDRLLYCSLCMSRSKGVEGGKPSPSVFFFFCFFAGCSPRGQGSPLSVAHGRARSSTGGGPKRHPLFCVSQQSHTVAISLSPSPIFAEAYASLSSSVQGTKRGEEGASHPLSFSTGGSPYYSFSLACLL